MKKIEVEITGNSPLLMHNIEGADLEGKMRKSGQKYNSEEDAEKAAYWTKNKKGKRELYVPARCVFRAMTIAASYMKIKGRSVAPLIAGAVRIEPEEILLGTDKYVIDKRPVVIQRARVMRSRPLLKEWKLRFDVMYNENYIADAEIIRQILNESGVKVGILDFRPQKKGYFGTFSVTKFTSK